MLDAVRGGDRSGRISRWSLSNDYKVFAVCEMFAARAAVGV